MSRQRCLSGHQVVKLPHGTRTGDALRPFPPMSEVECNKLGASAPRGVGVLGTTYSWKASGPTVGEPRFDDGKRVASK